MNWDKKSAIGTKEVIILTLLLFTLIILIIFILGYREKGFKMVESLNESMGDFV